MPHTFKTAGGIELALPYVRYTVDHWYSGDDRKAIPRRGLIVVFADTRWNYEHDTWESNAYLPAAEADEFEVAWRAWLEGTFNKKSTTQGISLKTHIDTRVAEERDREFRKMRLIADRLESHHATQRDVTFAIAFIRKVVG